MSEALTAEDVRILGLETERVAGHTLKVMELEERLALGELRAWVGARIGRVPRLTQRLDLEGPPSWVPDRGFDLGRHVRAGDGSVARIMEQRLDRGAPLWSIDLLEGGTVVVLKIHHAMADGMGARRIASALLWDVEEPAPAAATAARAGRRHVLRALTRELGPVAAPSALACRVGPARTVAFASLPLADLERLKHAFATRVTVNDLVLAVTAGGLRRWLPRHDEPLRVKVPVSLHRADESHAAVGNADSFFFVDLPVSEPDPERRLLAIARQAAARKRDGDARELDALMHGPVGRLAARWSMNPHVFTLNVSNVPGPRQPVTVCGRPVRAVYALAEVADRHALRVAVFSAGGTLTFGLCGDAARVDGLSSLAREIEGELALLQPPARTTS